MVPLSADSSSTVAEGAATAAAAAGEDPAFVRRYLRHVDPAEVSGRPPEDLLALASRHRSAAERRSAGQSHLHVSNGSVDVVTDDRPFLVAKSTAADSINNSTCFPCHRRRRRSLRSDKTAAPISNFVK